MRASQSITGTSSGWAGVPLVAQQHLHDAGGQFEVAEGVVDDISHEGLRVLLREEGVSFQRIKTWKASSDPEYEAKKARVEHLYAIADGEVAPDEGEPGVSPAVHGPREIAAAERAGTSATAPAHQLSARTTPYGHVTPNWLHSCASPNHPYAGG